MYVGSYSSNPQQAKHPRIFRADSTLWRPGPHCAADLGPGMAMAAGALSRPRSLSHPPQPAHSRARRRQRPSGSGRPTAPRSSTASAPSQRRGPFSRLARGHARVFRPRQCRRNDKNKSITHLSCKCDQGFLGHVSARKERDCSAMRTCGECQDHANRRFCGWCATCYCVPKHVQRALLKKSAEDASVIGTGSCPASPRATSSVPLTIGVDETSLQLAAALVSMIDGGGTRGNGWMEA